LLFIDLGKSLREKNSYLRLCYNPEILNL